MKRKTRTKSISLDPEVERKAVKLAKRRGFQNSFSAYISRLIEKDDAAVREEEKINGKAAIAA